MDWGECIALISECAKVMATFHTWSPCLLHRDLTSSCFLLILSSTGYVKINGISSAAFVDTNMAHTVRQTDFEELEYCAPECFNRENFSVYSDVYSFAIIMWEILNRHFTGSYQKAYVHFKNLKPEEFKEQIFAKLERPKLPNNCNPKMKELLEECWHTVPEQRPTFAEICNLLDQIRNTTINTNS